jgi:hypothetical protein
VSGVWLPVQGAGRFVRPTNRYRRDCPVRRIGARLRARRRSVPDSRGPTNQRGVVGANRVRQIFELYLEHQSLLAVVKELNARGWRTKRWTTRKGVARGGRQFDKTSLYQLLTKVAYIGKVRYKVEIHQGEHEPIIDIETFNQVETLLQRNGRSGCRAVRNKHCALLRGLLRCAACDCAMIQCTS